MAENNENEQGTQTAQISGTVQIKADGGAAKAAEPERTDETAPDDAPEKSSKKKTIIFAVVLLLVIVGGWMYYRSTFTEDTDDAQVDGNLYGVSARVAGHVTAVNVQDDQQVPAGFLLAEIDASDYQIALEQAEANLANAQATYQEAASNVPITSGNVRTQLSTSGSDVRGSEAGVAQSQKQTVAAQARVEQAKANAAKATADVERYTPLVQRDVISKQQFDAAVAAQAAANAQVLEAQAQVVAQQEGTRQAQQRVQENQAQTQQAAQNGPQLVKVQRAKADAAAAEVKQAQAKVDQAKLNLSYTKIYSPVAGIVTKKSVVVGGNVTGGEALMTIVPIDNLWVTANFKETQLEKMTPGQEVMLKVDALGGKKFHGKLSQVGGATGSKLSLFPPENATGNFVKVVQRIPVRIDFTDLAHEDPEHRLRPGFSVTPDVEVKK